jgi:hypothetical protein
MNNSHSPELQYLREIAIECIPPSCVVDAHLHIALVVHVARGDRRGLDVLHVYVSNTRAARFSNKTGVQEAELCVSELFVPVLLKGVQKFRYTIAVKRVREYLSNKSGIFEGNGVGMQSGRLLGRSEVISKA